MIKRCIVGAVVTAGLGSAGALAAPAKHHAPRMTVVDAGNDRPLSINGRRGRGLYRSGNDIVAPGGFGAHGYGYPAATPEERREASNAHLRETASGPYGYGADGLGGTGFGDDREIGGGNPFWGNGFNRYVGYNGVPTDLAFGPGFANRHLAEHDPEEDDTPGPTPGALGYALDPVR